MEGSDPPIISWLGEVIKSSYRQTYLTDMNEVLAR